MKKRYQVWLPILLVCLATIAASAQSFRVQCPTSTITHPANLTNVNAESAYTGPTTLALNTAGFYAPTANVNGAIKCQQVSGGDGYSTMADGTQTFMFSFGPLSGLSDIANGKPGTQFPSVFNTTYTLPDGKTPGTLVPGDPASTDSMVANVWPASLSGFPLNTGGFTWNGAVGLAADLGNLVSIFDITEAPAPSTQVLVQTNAPLGLIAGQTVTIGGTGGPPPVGYDGTYTITQANVPGSTFPSWATNYGFAAPQNFYFSAGTTGLPAINNSQTASASTGKVMDGHVDPRQIMDVGVMNGNIPAPLVAFDEDDEMFLTLTNVGMIMRPDLFEQHTIHFHGYPNASAVYDGVPDASVAINIGGSFTYYYLSPDAGTYFWHCHITPPEHLQMGMVGQLYVRPRQDRVQKGSSLYNALAAQQGDLRTACNTSTDILCSNPLPAANKTATAASTIVNGGTNGGYVYNDGDGSTYYDVEYPLQIHGFDPNFHFVGMTFNPEAFVDMKDKYFLLNGRSYPDTVTPGPLFTQSSDGRTHFSQPLPAIINIPVGGRALLRIADLSVSEYATLASLGIPMKEVGFNAKLLRDQAGNNMEFYTNSITLGGGESLDVILDASDAGCGSTGCAATQYPAGSVFYLYTPQLDHLSNDAENFGGLMTEVHICNSVTGNTYGNTCN